MEFILDTNAYRNLVRHRVLGDIPTYAKDLKRAEGKIAGPSILSIVVAMELIQHLQGDDPFRDECYKALCLQTLHTGRNDSEAGEFTGRFLPPMNEILSQYFFKKNSIFFHLYKKVLNLIILLTKKQDISNCDTNVAYVNTVRCQILSEKEDFKENVENFLRDLNGGTLDWNYFHKNRGERKKLFGKIQSGNITNILGLSLMERAHQVMGIEEYVPEAVAKIEHFISDFKAALIMNVNIIKLIGHGIEKLVDANDKVWNTINDVQILFGLLYSIDGDNKKVLVTDDKKIKKSCEDAGIGNKIMTQKEYLEMLAV